MATPDLTTMTPSTDEQPVDPRPNQVIDLDTGKMIDKTPRLTEADSTLMNMSQDDLLGEDPEYIASLPEIGVLENQLLTKGILPGGEPYDPEIGKSFRLSIGSMLSTDNAQHAEVVQNVLPDSTVRTLETGETIVNYKDQSFVLNRPGASTVDVTRFFGQFMAFLPAGKVGQITRKLLGKAATTRLLKPVAAGAVKQRLAQAATVAVASGATSAGLDVGSAAMGNGVDSESVDMGRAALATAMGGGGELIGPAFRAGLRKFRGTPDDLKYIDIESVRDLRQASDDFDMRIFEPQATGAKADSNYMRALQDLPETQQRMAIELSRQNQDASAMVTRYLDQIGDTQSIINAPARVRDTAIAAIDDMKMARSNLVRQGYQEAFAARTMVNVQPTISMIDDMLTRVSSDASNKVRRELVKYKGQINSDATDGMVDLEILHNVKMEMDEAIKNFDPQGPSGQAKLRLGEVNRNMVASMDESSPLYDSVKSIYRDASGPIEVVENSLVGQVSRITNDNLKKVLPSIFDAGQSNPAVLKNAKSIIESKDPEAWQQLLRAHLETNLGKISTRAVEGTPNTPLQLRNAIFGKNEVQERMILDSMTPEQQGSARWIDTLLKAGARGRMAGSDTAGKTEAIRDIKYGGLDNYFNPLSWPKNMTEVMKQSRFERRAEAFVDAMTNNDWSAEMSKLKELNPSDSASARALVQLVTRIEHDGIDQEAQ